MFLVSVVVKFFILLKLLSCCNFPSISEFTVLNNLTDSLPDKKNDKRLVFLTFYKLIHAIEWSNLWSNL